MIPIFPINAFTLTSFVIFLVKMTRIQSSSDSIPGSINYDPEIGNLQTSLLETSERVEGEENNRQFVDGPLSKLKTSPLEYFYGGLAISSVAVSISAMVTCSAAAVITSGILGCGLGPYGYYQQTKLTDMDALTETRDKFREEAEELQENVYELENTVNELGEVTTNLFEIVDCFNILTSSQNQSVHALEDSVNEQRKVVRSLENLLRTLILQNLLHVMIACDKNGDKKLDKDELDFLIQKINDINGAVLKEAKFRQEVKDSGGSIHTVMNHIKESLEQDVKNPHYFEFGFEF